MKVLVTGAKGFIGKNICVRLKSEGYDVFEYDIDSTNEELEKYVKDADFIIHLAGINRPINPEEFLDGNVNFTKKLLDLVKECGSKAPVFFSSSTQATKDNEYGRTKKMAEDQLLEFSKSNNHPVFVYRLYNVFGKWCRPNYNSVVATWCYNVTHDLPIEVNPADPAIDFVYVDDIVEEILHLLNGEKLANLEINYVEPHFNIHLSEIANALYSFKESRENLMIPELKPGFFKDLYSTFLTYYDEDQYAYDLNMHCDDRGSFTEMLKTNDFGQVSVNIAHPGIVKGNHYHHSKTEKYIVVSGSAVIKLRKVGTDKVIVYECDDKNLRVVDIPPGYTHSIMATGEKDSVTVMWANEPFDQAHPDTIFEKVE